MNQSICMEYDVCHIAAHLTTLESSLEKLSDVPWKGQGNLIGKVKADVYRHSGLGEMHRVRGLHKRLPGQVF